MKQDGGQPLNDLILEYFFEVVSQTTLIDGVIYAPLGLTISHCGEIFLCFGIEFALVTYIVFQFFDLLFEGISLLSEWLIAKWKKVDPSNT